MTKPKANPLPEGGPYGNLKAEKHGGDAALQSIQRGEEMRGLAADECKALEAQVQFSGWSSLLHNNAIRANAAAALYWSALQKAINDGDMVLIDRYTARFGWLVGVSNRSILEAMKAEQLERSDDSGVVETIALYRDGGEDAQNS